MADEMTGLGQTLADYEVMNGEFYLGDVIAQINAAYGGTSTERVALGELSVEGGALVHESLGKLVELQDDDYEKLCKVLGIPGKYILKLNGNMRAANVNYWLIEMEEREVTLVYRPDQIVEVSDGDEIRPLDVLQAVRSVIPNAKVFKVTNQTNSQTYDTYDEGAGYGDYVAGVRVVLKHGLNAPDISPIFLNISSCGIIECSAYLEKMMIKSLTYEDILRVIRERIENCVEAAPHLFATFERMRGGEVAQPHRRIALYCREHAIPDRVRAYALQRFDEAGLREATYGDIINLFSVIGYVDEVKQSSERKMQQLAGYVIVRSGGEKRCSRCDATLIEE